MIADSDLRELRRLLDLCPADHRWGPAGLSAVPEPERGRFETLYRRLYADPDLQALLAKTWAFVEPEPGVDAWKLHSLILQLRGEADGPWGLFDDIEACDAVVIERSVHEDAQGPDYAFRYKYGRGGQYEAQGRRGFDLAHCVAGRSVLDPYYAVGARIRCRYRRSDPKDHALREPPV